MNNDLRERVRAASAIEEVVGAYIHLNRISGTMKGLCPLHDDTKPSLTVNSRHQSWKCWVCDVGGDVFDFIMKTHGVGFPAAMHILARRAGIPTDVKITPRITPDRLYAILGWAAGMFHRNFAGSDGATYVESRGLTSSTLQDWHVGYAPHEFDWLTKAAAKEGYANEELLAAGLVKKKNTHYYDLFRGRVMFPVRNADGLVVAFGGRILPKHQDYGDGNEAAKYINTPETRMFCKSRTLFGFDRIHSNCPPIITEGYTDAIALHQANFPFTVAVMGTALTEHHADMLRKKHGSVFLLFDGDKAGRNRSISAARTLLKRRVKPLIAVLPIGVDPLDLAINDVSRLNSVIFSPMCAADFEAMYGTMAVGSL